MNMQNAPVESFQEDPPRLPIDSAALEADSLLLNIDGYEGPIEVLLELARNQKVDITKISILQLARQYLVFVERAKALNLELAAEYLVMAAWLAYLKSKLLLPKMEEESNPSAQEMAEALQFQLRRLEAMQKSAERLKNLPQLGQHIFARGMPEGLRVVSHTSWDANLYDILRAYGDIKRRNDERHYDLPEYNVMSTEDAMHRLTTMLGNLPRAGVNSVWATLQSFIPERVTDRLYARSSLASTFTAGLELVKQGKLEIKQDGAFKPVYMRAIVRAETAQAQE
jgi:segregation and condensation protein A